VHGRMRSSWRSADQREECGGGGGGFGDVVNVERGLAGAKNPKQKRKRKQQEVWAVHAYTCVGSGSLLLAVTHKNTPNTSTRKVNTNSNNSQR
jgi:hypothetical protein